MKMDEKQPSLEQRLKSLVAAMGDDLRVLLICKRSGEIIIGSLSTKSFMDYEQGTDEEDEGESADQDINTISMKSLWEDYIR